MPIPGRRASTTPQLGADTSTVKQLQETQESIQRQTQRLQKAEVPVPEKKKKAGVLERVTQLLRVAEPAPYVQAVRNDVSPLGVLKRQLGRAWNVGIRGRESKYKTPMERRVDRATFSDVLDDVGWEADSTPEKFGRAVVGLGLDVLTDPKTYLTFGAAKAGKLFVPKTGVVSLNSAGDNLLKKATKQFGEESGRKYMATHVARTGEKYLAKKGLKFMGAEVLPESMAKKPIKFVDDIMKRTPGVGRLYKGVKGWTGKAFNPWHEIEKLPKGTAEKFKRIAFNYTKGTKADQTRAINAIRKKALQSTDDAGEYLGRKLPQYIERGGNVTGDDTIDQLVKWFGREHQKLLKGERAAGLNVGEIENYITHYLGKGGKKYMDEADDLGQVVRAVSNINKSKPGFAKGRELLGSIGEINKKMRPVLDDLGIKGDFFETDAFKLLAKRKTESIQAIKSLTFFDEVSERFGYRFSELSDDVIDQLKTTASTPGMTKHFTKDGMKYVEANMDVFGGAKKLKNVYFPEPVTKHLKQVHAIISGKDDPANAFLSQYDKWLGIWKANVTGWFPAFHARNFMGGSFNNWLAGVKNPKWYKQARDIIRYKKLKQLGKEIPDDLNTTIKLAGKEMGYDDILKKAQNAQVFTMPGYADVMRTMDDRIKAIERSRGLKGFKELLTSKEGVKELGTLPKYGFEAVESQLRLPLFLNRLNKGDDVYSAAQQVFKYHFDYAPEALTTFERKGIKRFIPFYTWTRHNVPLQFEMLAKQPGKFAGMFKFQREMDAMAETERVKKEREAMPDWMNEMFTIRTPWKKNSGEPYYLQLDLPMEDLNKLNSREVVSLMSPLLKYPIERVANKYLYFDTPIYNENLPREYQLSRTMEQLKHLPQPVKDFLNIQEVKTKNYYTGEFEPKVAMDARAMHAIRSLWTSRWYSTFMRAMEPDTPAKEKLTRLVMGEPLRPLDLGREQWQRQKDRDAMLRDYLYHMKRTKRIPYAGEEDDFVRGSKLPKDTIMRRLGETLIK